MPGYPTYVDDLGHGLQVPRLPAGIFDATMYGFVIPADQASMQALADQFLSTPSGGAVTYHVLGDHAMLTFMRAPKLRSLGQRIGYLDDFEWAVWIPLLARSEDGRERDRIVLWTAYILINSGEGMATGREIWGFRKSVGQLDIPTDPGDAARCTAQGRVFDPLDPDTPGRWATVAEAWKDGPLGELESVWSDVKGLFEGLIALWTESGKLHVPRLGLVVDAAELLASRQVPVVNLKQFRDAFDSSRACYQALIESTCTPTRLYGGGPLAGQWKVKLSSYASYRLAEDLGVPAGMEIPATVAFWTRLDFTADKGREVWRAE